MHTRSRFLTFLFSLLPGAGHMYLGLIKTGASYMIAFFAVIALTTMPGLTLFSFAIPLIWCLSFFDCMNKSGYTDEQLRTVDDKFFFSQFFHVDDDDAKRFMQTKWPLILGGVLIFAGLYALIQNVLFGVLGDLFGYVVIRKIMSYIGTLIVSGALIGAGVWLIRGKKNSSQRF